MGRARDGGGELVDLAGERRRRGGAYRIGCGKCGEPIHERATRCEHCGIWFDGEAYQYAKPVVFYGRITKGAKILAWATLVTLGLLLGLAIVAALGG